MRCMYGDIRRCRGKGGYTYMDMYIRIHIYTYTYTYIYIHIHIYMYTYSTYNKEHACPSAAIHAAVLFCLSSVFPSRVGLFLSEIDVLSK